MADVRSLLRSELASRGSSAQTGSAGTRVNKKRKIESNDDVVRKKSRAVSPGPPKDTQPWQAPKVNLEVDKGSRRTLLDDEEVGPELPPQYDNEDGAEDNERLQTAVAEPQSPPVSGATNTARTIDEDEWAAFEREVVAPTRLPQVPAAAMAAATISAAPISVNELASRQRKEREELARAREADAEGEKEDAARVLEEEFDEMEQLEERLKRLKEKREELRRRNMEEKDQGIIKDAAPPEESQDTKQQADESEGEEDDDDDGDNWDGWRFR